MRYATNAELPRSIRDALPRGAQDSFRAAFNRAYDHLGPAHEARAFVIAWDAVKRDYVKRGAGIWIRRPAPWRGALAHCLRRRGPRTQPLRIQARSRG